MRGPAAINGWGQLLLVHTPLRQISLKWSLKGAGGERQLVLCWIETDVSLSGGRPKRWGFGTKMIERTLAYDMGGEASLRFEQDGLHCTIALPATEILVGTAAS